MTEAAPAQKSRAGCHEIESILFLERRGELAQSEFHHPVSISFGRGFFAIVLQTQKIEGLHENDFIMTTKINEISAGMDADE